VKQEHFTKLVEEVLESLPSEFRRRIHNLAVLVEDQPRRSKKWRSAAEKTSPGRTRSLVLGVSQGRPATQRSMFDLSAGPDRIVLYNEEHRSRLLQRGGNPSRSPANPVARTGTRLRSGRDSTSGRLTHCAARHTARSASAGSVLPLACQMFVSRSAKEPVLTPVLGPSDGISAPIPRRQQ
jgi:hypothetical protein